MRWVPWIAGVIRGDDLHGEVGAAQAERLDVEMEVSGSEGGEVFGGELKKPGCGPQAAAVFRMQGVEVLLLEMHESAGHLN
jgi:hypothetical protein